MQDIQKQLELKLARALAEIRTGKKFSLHNYPELPLLLIGLDRMNEANAIPSPEDDTFQRIAMDTGERMAAALSRATALLDSPEIQSLAHEYISALHESLTRREALAA